MELYFKVRGAARFDEHSEKVIVENVIGKADTDGYPKHAEIGA